MQSVKVRLSVLFFVVTTITVALFGVYAHFELAHELNSDFERLQTNTMTRLSLSLPFPLWGYDLTALTSIVKAEMQPREIRAIEVYDETAKIQLSSVRDPQNIIVTQLQPSGLNGQFIEAGLFYTAPNIDKDDILVPPHSAVGRVVVFFSRDRLDDILKADVRRKMIEVLVLDLILWVVLSLSLQIKAD